MSGDSVSRGAREVGEETGPPSQRRRPCAFVKGKADETAHFATDADCYSDIIGLGNDLCAPLRVVIKPLVPFVFADGDTYRGFSIDLWQEIADRMGRDYEYLYVDTVTEQLDAVRAGRGDLAITGTTITKEREQTLDFSLPYFRFGLQILALAAGGSTGWVTPIDLIRRAFSSSVFYGTLAGLALLIVLVGHIFWLLERGRNPDFPTAYVRGVWEGIWYSVVTLVTVGYGDRTTRTTIGRIVAMGWMFVSLLLVASFTANITSQLTVSQFQGLIQGPEDLPGNTSLR